MNEFANIFKAYDIRGLVDVEIDVDFTFATGVAFARFLQIEREPGTIVIGEDMRPSSSPLADAFSAGVNSQGMDVVRIGLASTDMLYFASGKLGLPGAMFTASHNPAEYNGIKLCFSGARPIGKESGLVRIEDFVREEYNPKIAIVDNNDGQIISNNGINSYLIIESILIFSLRCSPKRFCCK